MAKSFFACSTAYSVTEYLLKEFAALGIPARRTIKGGVIADFGGKEDEKDVYKRQVQRVWCF